VDTLRQLRHVVALAEHRHFGRAADAVGITQAALTQSIQKVEAACGVQLFERHYGDVTPTVYGELVIETARATLAGVTNMHRQLRLMRKLATGRLIIGCDPYFAEPVVTPPLIRLLNQYPNLEFTLELGGWETLQEKLIARELDIYLGFPHEAMDSHIAIETHVLPPVVVFCRAGHQLANARDVPPSVVFQFPIVVPKASRWLRQKLEALYPPEGGSRTQAPQLPAYLLTTDFGIIRQVVLHSDALAAAIPHSLEAELAAGTLAPVGIKAFDFDVPLVIASVARRSLPPAAHALLTEVRRELASISGIASPSAH